MLVGRAVRQAHDRLMREHAQRAGAGGAVLTERDLRMQARSSALFMFRSFCMEEY